MEYWVINYVKDLYPGDAWRKKVDKMSDSQVLAIYYRALQKGQKPIKKAAKPSAASGSF